jgi:hypothetical protein
VDVFNGFEGNGGTNITTANSDDNEVGAQPIVTDIAGSANGAVAQYNQSIFKFGNSSARCFSGAAAAGGRASLGWTAGAVGSCNAGSPAKYVRYYGYLTANPTVSGGVRIGHFTDSGLAFTCEFRISTTGKLLLCNNVGTTLATSITSIPLNAWFRIELATLVFSTTVGQISARLYTNPDSTSLTDPGDELISAANLNTVGAGGNAGIFMGNGRTAINHTVYIDGARASDTFQDGWIGPVGAAQDLEFEALSTDTLIGVSPASFSTDLNDTNGVLTPLVANSPARATGAGAATAEANAPLVGISPAASRLNLASAAPSSLTPLVGTSPATATTASGSAAEMVPPIVGVSPARSALALATAAEVETLIVGGSPALQGTDTFDTTETTPPLLGRSPALAISTLGTYADADAPLLDGSPAFAGTETGFGDIGYGDSLLLGGSPAFSQSATLVPLYPDVWADIGPERILAEVTAGGVLGNPPA